MIDSLPEALFYHLAAAVMLAAGLFLVLLLATIVQRFHSEHPRVLRSLGRGLERILTPVVLFIESVGGHLGPVLVFLALTVSPPLLVVELVERFDGLVPWAVGYSYLFCFPFGVEEWLGRNRRRRLEEAGSLFLGFAAVVGAGIVHFGQYDSTFVAMFMALELALILLLWTE